MKRSLSLQMLRPHRTKLCLYTTLATVLLFAVWTWNPLSLQKHHITSRKLNAIRIAIMSYAVDYGGATPPLRTPDLARFLRASKENEFLVMSLGEDWDLRDAFGNYLYVRKDEGEASSLITIRSAGSNGVDDGGDKDDMEVKFTLDR